MKWRFIVLLLFVNACNIQHREVEKYELPAVKEINAVIAAVIVQDSLFYGENKAAIPLAVDLYQLNLYFPDSSNYKNEPPPPPWFYNFYELIREQQENVSPFTVQDSAYLLYQIDALKALKIDSTNFKNIYFTTWKEQESKLTNHQKTSFYRFSIPVFSQDLTKAYVELNFICYKLCGYGKEYQLKQENEKWKVIEKNVKWFE